MGGLSENQKSNKYSLQVEWQLECLYFWVHKSYTLLSVVKKHTRKYPLFSIVVRSNTQGCVVPVFVSTWVVLDSPYPSPKENSLHF